MRKGGEVMAKGKNGKGGKKQMPKGKNCK